MPIETITIIIIAVVVAFLLMTVETVVLFITLRQVRIMSRESNLKLDSLTEKTNEIHVMTNSNLTRVTAELAGSNIRIASLERLLMSLFNQKPPEGKAT